MLHLAQHSLNTLGGKTLPNLLAEIQDFGFSFEFFVFFCGQPEQLRIIYELRSLWSVKAEINRNRRWSDDDR